MTNGDREPSRGRPPPGGGAAVRFADPAEAPLRLVLNRLLAAFVIIGLITLVVWLDRDGYRDSADTAVDLLDAFYYATVAVTTTGYGDIVPVDRQSRLVTALVVTPLRAMFLVLVVSTTVEVLTATTRYQFRVRRWRRRVSNHYVICGYGTKGSSAARLLMSEGVSPDEIVIVERDSRAVGEANRDGLVVVEGDATRESCLREAGVRRAKAIVVAVDRDDTAVLVTLTARSLNPGVRIVAAVRQAENAPLLRRGGAASVIVSDEATGRLLALAIDHPHHSEMIEDLLLVGEGIELVERAVDEAGAGGATPPGTVAVVRDGRLFPAPLDGLQAGDRLLLVSSAENGPDEEAAS